MRTNKQTSQLCDIHKTDMRSVVVLTTKAAATTEDEEMGDAQDEKAVKEETAGDEADGEEGEAVVDDVDMGEEDEDEAQLEEVDSNATPEVEGGTPRKRRVASRTPRIKATPDLDDSEIPGEEPFRIGTPRRGKARGRGGFRGGFRKKARVGAAAAVAEEASRQVVDKDGNTVEVNDDELDLPEDAEGETKVDKMGNLSGNREYRVRLFKVLGRGDRMYMLSTEPARCMGFRDSYLFFARHTKLFKVVLDDEEKRDMIDRDIIPHSYKGRAITVVTARSVFREFGAKIIIGGRKVTDDYYATEARERGDIEGELAAPDDKLPIEKKTYNKNQYVAWHGASSVYHNTGPVAPLQLPGGKRKTNVNMGNWMFEHSRAASIFNSQLAAARRRTLNGVYDPHTNLMCYPRIMQPTHARWEYVPPESPSTSRKRKLDALSVVENKLDTTASSSSDLAVKPIDDANSSSKEDASIPPADSTTSLPTTQPPTTSAVPLELPTPSNLLTRNYLIVDTLLETAPYATLPIPGPEEPETTPLYTGSGRMPDLGEEDLALLPKECRAAFLEAKREEGKWRDRWGTQERDGWRGEMRIGVGVLGI